MAFLPYLMPSIAVGAAFFILFSVHSSRKRESSRRQVMKGSIKPEMMEDFWMGMMIRVIPLG